MHKNLEEHHSKWYLLLCLGTQNSLCVYANLFVHVCIKGKKKIGELSSLKWIAECQKVPLPNKPLKTAVMINIDRVFQKLMTDSSSQ